MGRSVVRHGTVRCPRCQLAPRWCVCAGMREVELPLGVDVLMHASEEWKPTSTGNLIERVVPGMGRHIYHHERLLSRESVERSGRTLWVLHPRGDALGEFAPLPPAGELQVLLIDGTWAQANVMLRHVEGWGRKVSLPMSGESRYWLRSQHSAGHFSTMEALLFLLGALGLAEAQERLRVQFELHVYANLLARGRKAAAVEFLEGSPLGTAMPEVLERVRAGGGGAECG